MSEVISFRLNPDNPREAQALEILKSKQSEGFSRRQVLTDALIGLVAENGYVSIDEFNSALEQLSGLFERVNVGNHNQCQPMRSQVVELRGNFINSVKTANKPGLNLT